MIELKGRRVRIVESGEEGVIHQTGWTRGGMACRFLIECTDGHFELVSADSVTAIKPFGRDEAPIIAVPKVWTKLLGEVCAFIEAYESGTSAKASFKRLTAQAQAVRNYIRNESGKPVETPTDVEEFDAEEIIHIS